MVNYRDVQFENAEIEMLKKGKSTTQPKINTGLMKEGAFNDKVIKSIKKELMGEKLIITKTDKENCIVIVKKKVYNQISLEFSSNNGIKGKMIAPSTLIKRTGELLKRVQFVFEIQLRSENTNFLVLYGLLKLHKSDRIEEMPI
ncbi:hypothetical protein HHI36_022375 [Cryptolaemus montrouzieri]|uniref:DUF1934 domain-containing protein n=1 Tax=Cryptolaemus montrouzieri TaxID=559131 RepID=A0ABD2MZM1_9CUCU